MKDIIPKLLRLTHRQIPDAVDTLCRAFQDAELFSELMPDPKERLKKLPVLVNYIVRWGYISGEVWITSPRIEGVAVWFPPESSRMGLISQIRAGALSLLWRLGLGLIKKLVVINNFITRLHIRNSPTHHTYLCLLGVDPRYQGMGWGKRLMEPMIEHLDLLRLPCYLDTQRENNLNYYRKFGFELVETAILPLIGIHHWCMVRMPIS